MPVRITRNLVTMVALITTFLLNQMFAFALIQSKEPRGLVTAKDLRCEYTVNPIGIGTASPRLSWIDDSGQRGELQSAYQVLVSSSPERLRADEGDLWDSGKVASDQNAHIVYRGQPLISRQRCYWKVRLWDRAGHSAGYSDSAWWEMALMRDSDWKAEWITMKPRSDEDRLPLAKSWWISSDGQPAGTSTGVIYFRRAFELPSNVPVRRAELLVAADAPAQATLNHGNYQVWVNGKTKDAWKSGRTVQCPSFLDVKDALKPGANWIAMESGYALDKAVIGLLSVEMLGGSTIEIATDASWKALVELDKELNSGWEQPGADESGWRSARQVARLGGGPWPDDSPYKKIDKLVPAPLLRKRFEINKAVLQARIYATAAGVYELYLNGQRVGDQVLAPGWTDYPTRILYQTYDVTSMLKAGPNVLGAIVGDGWFSGNNGLWKVNDNAYGYDKALLCQLQVDYDDGSSEIMATDGSWRCSTGPIRWTDLFMGEIYDARAEIRGWNRGDFDDSTWIPAVRTNVRVGRLEPQSDPPIRQIEELRTRRLTEPRPGVFVFDLGQNIAGRIRLKVSGPAGTHIVLRHGEIINRDGTLFTENLRRARAADEYTLKGQGQEVYEPRFTFHGFRYVEATGFPGKPSPDAVTGIAISSDLRRTGLFECSNPILNKLQSNIVWSQKGNFVGIPTDCPQRDERDGWMGDAQIFVRTAAFNMDSAAFFGQWMADVESGQSADGIMPDIAPIRGASQAHFGWGDAGVIVPWTIYLVYGDTRIIERYYDSMSRWIAYLEKHSSALLAPTSSYGDWLSPPPQAPNDVLSTAYFAYVTHLMSKMAAAIGKRDDAERYEDTFQKIKSAFNTAYVEADGRIKSDTQTVYVLALRFDLLDGGRREAAARRLVAAIERSKWHLGTGFLGTGNLLPALSEAGRTDIAYRLLENDTYPSWGYEVKNGATTIWERWNGFTEGAEPENIGNMNSLNHYAYGAVGEWMYGTMAGIIADPARPGFKHIIIHPEPGGAITYAKAEYDSIQGKISSSWRVEKDTFHLELKIPANTSATVYIPADSPDKIKEGGRSASQSDGVRFVKMAGSLAVFEVGSGSYKFTAATVSGPAGRSRS